MVDRCAWRASLGLPASTLAVLASLALGGCIAPSVLESRGRVIETREELAWRAALAQDFQGLFESVQIDGEAAASLGKVFYYFTRDPTGAFGTYTGAALVLGDAEPQFQTLGGSWRLDGDRLDLGAGEPVRVQAVDDRLRMESAGGVAILRRTSIQ